MTASLRAAATLALRSPLRLVQKPRSGHFLGEGVVDSVPEAIAEFGWTPTCEAGGDRQRRMSLLCAQSHES